MNTIAEALQTARERGLESLDAQLLIAQAVRRPRSWVLAHGETPLTESQRETLTVHLQRRAEGEPLAYLIGQKEFYGLTLGVSAGVLVPRPDTETLVDWALECLAAAPPQPEVLDLGTGSGAIALALAHACPTARVCAVDMSETALQAARDNAMRLALQVQWLAGDWCSPLGERRFSLIVSNPPYVADRDPHLQALRHEPAQALLAGADGLDAIRTIVSQAPKHMLPQAWLLLEHAHAQAPAVAQLLRGAGFIDVTSRADLSGEPRCTGGHL